MYCTYMYCTCTWYDTDCQYINYSISEDERAIDLFAAADDMRHAPVRTHEAITLPIPPPSSVSFVYFFNLSFIVHFQMPLSSTSYMQPALMHAMLQRLIEMKIPCQNNYDRSECIMEICVPDCDHHSLLLSDMLEASFAESSVMLSSFIARYSPPRQRVLSIFLPPPLVSNDKCTSHDTHPLSGKATGQCLKMLTGEQTYNQQLSLCRHL